MAEEEDLNTLTFLTWRRLYLSRAKLKESGKTSALLSGFAMVAMVEMEFNHSHLGKPSKIPKNLYVIFAVCTTLLVVVHILALMISTCILPNMDAVCSLCRSSHVHEFPQSRLHWCIETAWIFTTVVGLLLFLVEIAIISWIKFLDVAEEAAWASCIILIPAFVLFFAFAVYFYRSLVAHKYELTVSGLKELELLRSRMEMCDIECEMTLLKKVHVNSPET